MRSEMWPVSIIILLIVISLSIGMVAGKVTDTLNFNQELLVEINNRSMETETEINKRSSSLDKELAELRESIEEIHSKLIEIDREILKIRRMSNDQYEDIIVLTEAIMSFKDIWETLELQKFTATAYSPFDNVSGIENDGDPTNTATGTYPDWGTFAVDPRVIPYHSKIIVIGDNFIEHGVALDTGATMRKFGTWIDLYRDTYQQTLEFGKQDVFVLWQEP